MEAIGCPYCGQDDVWRVSIPGIDENAMICKECDTLWTHDEKVEDGLGVNFGDLMAKYGRSNDWKHIIIEEQVLE